jgi:hypothetical protein
MKAARAGKTARPGTMPIASLPLKPLPSWQAAFFFGIPAILVALGFLVVLPALQQSGMERAYAFTLVQAIFVGGLIPATLIAVALEGRPLNWLTLRARLRLKTISGQAWTWVTIGVLAFVGSYYAGVWITTVLVKQFGLSFPNTNFPLDQASAINRALWLVNIAIGIAAEEFWYRGYILPRQELAHDENTWKIHGVLWALVHIGYSGWFTLALLIPCMVLSFIAQGLKNTTAGITLQVFLSGMNLLIGGF